MASLAPAQALGVIAVDYLAEKTFLRIISKQERTVI